MHDGGGRLMLKNLRYSELEAWVCGDLGELHTGRRLSSCYLNVFDDTRDLSMHKFVYSLQMSLRGVPCLLLCCCEGGLWSR